MHIPSSMLHGAVCPVTVAVGAAGVGAALYVARKANESPTAAKFAAVTAMIFALQMLNFPVQNGTSGHLLGGMLAVAFLGIPWAVLSMSLVLSVQAIFFGDGGVNALGANIINMGLIGAGAAGLLFNFLQGRKFSRTAALAVASMASVLTAALACSVEISLAGTVSFSRAVAAMLSVHALIGTGEAVLTVVLVAVISAVARKWAANEMPVAIASLIVAVVAAMLSPFASNFPDGLEWVSAKMAFISFKGVQFAALFPDYQVPAIGGSLSTVLAGLIGVGIVLAVAALMAKAIAHFPMKRID